MAAGAHHFLCFLGFSGDDKREPGFRELQLGGVDR